MKYAVIYARYSSDRQNDMSIDGQIAECRKFAESHDMIIVQEYIDRAFTATTDKRPEFLRMIEESKNKEFEIILVYQLDRFARNKDDSGYYKKILRENGVKVVSAMERIAEDSSGVITEGMLEIVADWYSKQLSEKVTRGLRQRAELKKYPGGVMTYGYAADAEGYYILDPERAPVVKELFERVSHGETIQSVMDDFNMRGIKTTKNKPFVKNSLQHILRNERYKGIYIFDDIRIPDGMPRIISDELFDDVQTILDRNKHRGRRRPKEEDYILTGKLFCGKCKSPMLGTSGTSGSRGTIHRYYSCKCAPHKCDKKNVRKETIEKLIVSECQNLITDSMIDKLVEAVAIANSKDQESIEIIRLRKDIKATDQKIEKLLTKIEDGADSDRLIERLKQREQDLKTLKAQLKAEERKQRIMDTDIVRRILKEMQKVRIEEPQHRAMLVKVFIDKIYLYEDHFSIFLNYDSKDKLSHKDTADIERSLEKKSIKAIKSIVGVEPIKVPFVKNPLNSTNTVLSEPLHLSQRFCHRDKVQ